MVYYLLQINLPLVAGLILLAGFLVGWLFVQNRRDRRALQDKLNRDYRHPREETSDPDPEPPLH